MSLYKKDAFNRRLSSFSSAYCVRRASCAPEHGTPLPSTAFQIPLCTFIAICVSCRRPRKILFVNMPFAMLKGTCSSYFLNLSYCLIKVMCYLRLHVWKKKCCKPWERQTTNPFHFGAILVRFQNHIRKARLKSLSLSSFNHTAGRRFLPFGITAISIWL